MMFNIYPSSYLRVGYSDCDLKATFGFIVWLANLPVLAWLTYAFPLFNMYMCIYFNNYNSYI